MSHILAIDQGTTGSRAIVFDRRGRAVSSAYEEFPQYFPRPGWVEHDPEEIWRSVYRTIQKALAAVPGRSIAAVGITNQRETTVIWDRRSGRPVANAIVWQCRRTAGRCRELAAEPGMSRLIRKKTGLPIDAYFSATKAEWILDRGGLRERAKRGRLAFGTTDTWVLSKLTGGASHATDPTNASRTMLFNIRRLDWDEELLELFGIPAAMLPRVLPSSGEFGRTVRQGRLPAGIPIMGIAGDQQAALFGQAGFRPGAIKNTYGTGSFILLNTGRELVESRHGLITTVACGPGGKAVYALEGSVFVAGAAIQWLRDQLGLLGSAAESEAAAGAVADNAGVYFVPAFVGLGAPYWDAEARGTIVGLTRGAGREPSRPGGRRGHGLFDPRRPRDHAQGLGSQGAGAPGRRRRLGQRLPLPVPGRYPGRAGRASEGGGDDLARGRLSRGPRRGTLGFDGGDRAAGRRRAEVHAGHDPGPGRQALCRMAGRRPQGPRGLIDF